ncbi:hypothetical protein L218DRAFT_964495 [Marasmius fiardii PR-910]|nr:hypothetical protein L218DRAFT_964495 [Marasmius fiardii PR-910]
MEVEEFYLSRNSSREGEGPVEYSRRSRHASHSESEFYLQAHPEACMTECVHSKGTCPNPFEHVGMASVRKHPQFLKVKKDFEEFYQSDLKKTISMHPTSSIPAPSSKRKTIHDSSSQMDIDPAPPAKRAATSHSKVPISENLNPKRAVVPHIDFHIIDAETRPRQLDLTLISFSNHRAGFDAPETRGIWDRCNGRIIPPDYIQNLGDSDPIPTPMSFSGQSSGLQAFPSSSQEFFQLVADARVPGNFIPAIRVLLMRSVAATLDHLHRVAPEQVPVPSGVVFDCLRTTVYPDWFKFTVFIDVQRAMKPSDSSQNWTSSPALVVPAVAAAPPPGSSVEELGQGTFVHYSHTAHCGILHTDSGHTFIPNLRGHKFLLEFSPPSGDSTEAKSLSSQFKYVCISLMACPGLYGDVTSNSRISIAPTRQVVVPTRADVANTITFARHLAKCGVTVEEMNDYVVYGMVYCQHICRLTYFRSNIRQRYALIFIIAQYRLLFYPVPTPSGSITYRVPQHWNLDHIQEYRRRQNIIRRWKDTDDSRLESPGYQFPMVQQNPQSSSDSSEATQGVDAMKVDNDNVQSGQPESQPPQV